MRNPVPQESPAFYKVVTTRWPGFPFHRKSGIHASFMRQVAWPKSRSGKSTAIAYQVASDFGQQLLEFLDKHFPETTWLLKPDDLQALLLNDTINLWEDGQTVETLGRLRNPNTGNYFHRIGLNNGVAFGVRVWVGRGAYSSVSFRVRLEAQDESEPISRMKLQKPVADAINRLGEVKNEIGEDALALIADMAHKYVSTSLAGNQTTEGLYPKNDQQDDGFSIDDEDGNGEE